MNKKRFNEIVENINKHNILQSFCGGLTSYDCMISELLEYTLDLQQENQQLEEKLQQRDEVIEEAIKFINKTQYDTELKNHVYGINHSGTIELLDILNKYKNKVGE